MSTDNEYVVVGKVGATYGVKGWLKIISFTQDVANILDYTPWYLQESTEWKAIKIEAGRSHGKGIVVKFPKLETPEAARLYTGKTIAVKRSQLPVLKKNEYYWSDIEGLTVIDQRGDTLGKIIYLMETGSNDVLVIKGEKEHAIPYILGDVVTDIDLEKKVMHVNWDLI